MEDENDIQGSGVYAPEVLEFVRSANDYCSWLEESDKAGSVAFIRLSLSMLSRIYFRIVCLEEMEPAMEGSNEKFVTEQDWSSVYQKVLHLLGSHNEYLRIADEGEFDKSDLVTHNISEDLADIYQDLKDFTLQYRQGIEEIMNDAVWEVMENFEQYWSEKLLNALRALNKLYISKINPEADTESPEEPDDGDTGPSYDNSLFTRMQDLNEEDI
ncbi:MAG: DUF5063 domain-containing protein [Bacteroidales bacterium]